MSRHAYHATQIVAQLYPTEKAKRLSSLIQKATSDYEVDRILRAARLEPVNNVTATKGNGWAVKRA